MNTDQEPIEDLFDLAFWTAVGRRASRITRLPVVEVLDGVDEANTRILIVDPHQVVAQGLAVMLGTIAWIEVLDVVGSGEQALERVATDKVDLTILDVKLDPSMNGVDLIKRIKGASPKTRVLCLSVFSDPSTVAEAIAAGAEGYMSKGASQEAVIQAITDILEGKSVLDPNVAEGIFDRIGKRDPQALTERELEVIQQFSYGKTSREVAAQVHVSEETVKTYLKQIYRKLNVHDRTEAVAESLRRGLIH